MKISIQMDPLTPRAVLPPIPVKRYFTIGEVSELCAVKPHVLRYWEQEFYQLKPVKRRGNRRYYQHHEVLLIRRIRELLYDQGFTINGARNQLDDQVTGIGRNGKTRPLAVSALLQAANGHDTKTDVIPPEALTQGASVEITTSVESDVAKNNMTPDLLKHLRKDIEAVLSILRS